MSKTIAITGATGFAGRHAVTELLQRAHRLRALVRNPETAGLPAAVETVQGDLADAGALARLTAGADGVVHLAGALAALSRADYFKVNEQGTRALVHAVQEAGVSRFVHISSLAASQPQLSAYAASKRAGEEIVLARMAALNAIIIRPPAVYGPGDKGTLPLIRELTRPVAAIPGIASARFSLIHGRDLARLIALVVEGGAQGLHEVSDGRQGGYGWADLIRTASAFRGGPVRAIFLPRAVPAAVAHVAEGLARLTGKPGMVNRGKIAELYHPDWVAHPGGLSLPDPTPFDTGFAETVTWYRKAGWLPRGRGADRRTASSRTFQ
ncbi:NAD(P)-dependent oxidoreductase [Aestuariivirga sp.]|uniref:NAD-dependent epimerase/dehydratase family protein n=1 Tax=Aestuariivirga sp. TaxID=2650926 RepID=UPI0025C2CA8A|nr:NAD-dependent epimerase/dehydratase family protein [Aestuariivirga sp.]MCA3555067.1 NAD-dependent epimerase/dehydratase family protein [Aestuariivirga sp.]